MPRDFSKYTDEELDRLIQEEEIKRSVDEISSLSDVDLDKQIQEEESKVKVKPEDFSYQDYLKDRGRDIKRGAKAAVTGAVKGLSAGFSDELSGGIQAGIEKLRGKKENLGDLYRKYRDLQRKSDERTMAASPTVSKIAELGGMVASPAGAIGRAAKGAGWLKNALRLAAEGGTFAAGTSEADLTKGEYGEAARDITKGAAIGGGIGVGGKAIGSGVRKISPAIRRSAEEMAEKATGATGLQASRFQKGAGGELLDRGVVRFGRSVDDVAEQSRKQMAESWKSIDESLKELDYQGLKIDRDDILKAVDTEISKLQGVSAKAPARRQLESIRRDILEAQGKKGEGAVITGTQAEVEKRTFDQGANWLDPEAAAAKKIAGGIHRRAVEKGASEIDPSIASKFKEEKKAYGLLSPIKEAAERRASSVSQQPIANLRDFVAYGVGGVPGVVGRRVLTGRGPSSIAVSLDQLQKLMNKPSMAKWANILNKAARRGASALSAKHHLLMKGSPEYRKAVMEDE